MSISDTWSPLESDTLHSSSSAAIEECEIASSDVCSSSSEIPNSWASSASVAARCKLCSSFELARSISLARARTLRGTQSIERSSSMIAPLMRVIAYVSNLISREGSKRSIAEIKPTRP